MRSLFDYLQEQPIEGWDLSNHDPAGQFQGPITSVEFGTEDEVTLRLAWVARAVRPGHVTIGWRLEQKNGVIRVHAGLIFPRVLGDSQSLMFGAPPEIFMLYPPGSQNIIHPAKVEGLALD